MMYVTMRIFCNGAGSQLSLPYDINTEIDFETRLPFSPKQTTGVCLFSYVRMTLTLTA